MECMGDMFKGLWNWNKNTNKDVYKSFTTIWRKKLYWTHNKKSIVILKIAQVK